MAACRLFPRSGLFKYLDDGGVAMPCRLHQGCLAISVFRMHVRLLVASDYFFFLFCLRLLYCCT